MVDFDQPEKYELLSEQDAVELQERLAHRVELNWTGHHVATIAGADTAFPGGGNGMGLTMYASIVVLDAATLEVIEVCTATGTVDFEYLSGLLSFREIPLLSEAWKKVETKVDVLIVDGYGVLHPRHFGLACHAGLLFGVPCFGVAKNRYIGRYPEPDPERGSVAPAFVNGEKLGESVRTQTGIKPVYVSPGHLIDQKMATRLTLQCSPEYRVPEPTRQADLVVNAMMRNEPSMNH